MKEKSKKRCMNVFKRVSCIMLALAMVLTGGAFGNLKFDFTKHASADTINSAVGEVTVIKPTAYVPSNSGASAVAYESVGAPMGLRVDDNDVARMYTYTGVKIGTNDNFYTYYFGTDASKENQAYNNVNARPGMQFIGWTVNGDASKIVFDANGGYHSQCSSYLAGVTGKWNLVATWIPRQYSITLLNSDGSSAGYTSVAATWGGPISGLPSPVGAANQSFAGWTNLSGNAYTNGSLYDVADNMNLYANWTTAVCHVHLEAGTGVTGITINDTPQTTIDYDVAYGTTVNFQTLGVDSGYNFTGWTGTINGESTSLNNSFNSITATGDINLTATAMTDAQLSASKGHVYMLTNGAYYYLNSSTISNKYTSKGVDISYDYEEGIKVPFATTDKSYAQSHNVMYIDHKTGYTFKDFEVMMGGGTITKTGDIYYVTPNIKAYCVIQVNMTKNSYTVKYDGNGANSGSVAPQTVKYDETFTMNANQFVKTGYKFKSWRVTAYEVKDGGSVKNLTYKNNDVITAYAQWSPITYKVTFNNNCTEDYTSYDMVCTYDKESTLYPTVPTRPGYNFKGWSTDKDATEATYTNGSAIKNLSATQDATVTLYAVWKANTYEVVYNGNGANTGSIESQLMKYDKTYSLTENSFARTGYKFLGWSLDQNATEKTYADKEEVKNLTAEDDGVVTLYAVWKAIEYTVEYDTNNGSTAEKENMGCVYDVEAILNPTVPTRKGYTYLGWSLEKNAAEATYQVGDKIKNLTDVDGKVITLYAVWKANTCVISFDPNGASTGSMLTQTLTYDVETNLSANAYSKKGYKFSGWGLTNDATEKAYTDGQKVLNISEKDGDKITLYAIWKSVDYKIVFDGNGATSGSVGNMDMSYDESKVLPENNFVRNHYSFKGWALDKSATAADFEAGATVSNLTETDGETVTLYAIWKADEYGVSLVLPDSPKATIINNVTKYAYGEKTILPTKEDLDFDKDTYNFKGWFEDADYSGDSVVKIGEAETGDKTYYAKIIAKVDDPDDPNYVSPTPDPTPTKNPSDLITGGDVNPDVTPSAKPNDNFTNNLVTNGGTVNAWNEDFTADIIKLPTDVTRPGYTFGGWYLTADCTGDPVTQMSRVDFENGVKVYAKWTPNTYKISYVLNDGAVTVTAPTSYTYGTITALPTKAQMSKTGYSFAGWYAAADFSGTVLTSISATDMGDKVVYAKWTIGNANVEKNGMIYHISSSTTCTLVGTTNRNITKVTSANTTKVKLTYKGKTSTYKVMKITNSAFKNCTKLKSVVVGKYVKNIGACSFMGCKSLKTVSINTAKTLKIKSSVFRNDSKLKKITIKASKMTAVGKNSLKGINKKCVIKVNKSKFKKYKKLLSKKGQAKTVKIKK